MNQDDLELELDEELEKQLLLEAIESEFADKEIEENNESDDNNEDNSDEKIVTSSKKRKRKFKISSKKLKNHLKIRTVLLLLLTLIVNTYAWFIYVSTVSTSMDVHVKSWDFELSNGDQNEDFVFTVEQIYPGMEDVSQLINARNNGEAEAKLVCEISSVKILGTKYTVDDEYVEDGETKLITSQYLIDKLLNDYPFKIQIYLDDVLYDGTETIMQTGDTTKIEFKIVWPYETGTEENEITVNDAEDTKWGNDAYEYYKNGGDKYCIEVKLHIQAGQAKSETEETPTP